MRPDYSVARLRQLLKMLDSQIILEYEGMNARRMQEGDIMVKRNTKKPDDRKRHISLSRPGIIPSAKKTLTFGPYATNNDHEEDDREDVANQSSQMLSILREEKRKSLIPPSTALSSSIFKSPPRPTIHRPGPASKTGRRSLRVHKSDRRLSHGGVPTDTGPSKQKEKRFYHPLRVGKAVCDSKKSDRRLTVKKEKPDEARSDKTIDVNDAGSVHMCPFCNKDFSRRGRLKSHIAQAHPDPDTVKHYDCPHCEFTTTNPGSLRSHLLKTHRDKVEYYICNYCSKNFTTFVNWKKHRNSCEKRKKEKVGADGHKERKRHAVSNVSKKSKAAQSSGVKMTRASPSSYNCLDCFNSFSSRLDLIKHKLRCKTLVGPPYVCKDCNSSFSKKERLAYHVQSKTCCPIEKERNKDCGASASKEKSNHDEHENVAAEDENEDNDHHVSVEGHGDPDETRDDHISCKECVKVFTQEDFKRHQEQTGHTGEIIKLPKELCI